MSSGALPNGGIPGVPADFQVQINAAAGKIYTYTCLIHPGMTGTVTVVPPSTSTTTQAAADAAGAAQYNSLTAAARPAEAAAQHPAPPTINPDGSKTWIDQLGLEVDDIGVLEMLPSALPIAKGDSVTF